MSKVLGMSMKTYLVTGSAIAITAATVRSLGKDQEARGVDIAEKAEEYVKQYDGRPQGNGDGAIHGASEGALTTTRTSGTWQQIAGDDTATESDDTYVNEDVRHTHRFNIQRLAKEADPDGAPVTAEQLERVMKRYDKGDGVDHPADDDKLGGKEWTEFRKKAGPTSKPVSRIVVEKYP